MHIILLKSWRRIPHISTLRVWRTDDTGLQSCGEDGRATNMLLERGSGRFSCRSKPADCVYMASTFPSFVVCGRSAIVVFTEARLDIIMFTWMTDHTSVMIVFSLCCFYSALFCTAPSLGFKVPLRSDSAATTLPIFQSAAAHLPFHIGWPPCISTGNCSLGGL